MSKVRRFQFKFSFRNRVIAIALGLIIATLSLMFTNRMARQLKVKEQREMELWAEAIKLESYGNIRNDIPFIITDENMKVVNSHLVSDNVLNNSKLLYQKLMEMSRANSYLEIETMAYETRLLFYGQSQLLRSLVYFPYVQLGIIIVIVGFGFITFRSSKHAEQNRVWIGLAKETAHQLGTPTSSLLGWIEYLRTQNVDQTAIEEMNKDIVRLTKVVERFSKIGSQTELKEGVVNDIVGGSVLYFRSRVPKNVTIGYNGFAMAPQLAMVNEALFEWVIENLLKNALDALAGKGEIDVNISAEGDWIHIDVRDSGKGISKNNFKQIFEPGFTTKTRGWGLGLSLSKRIIDDYHRGKIFVMESEIGVGTTIRVSLKHLYV